MPNDTTSAWILGVIMGLLALLGLIMADPVFYRTGLALTAFGVLFVFALINGTIGRD